MWTVIIRNVTTEPIEIEDLGIVIAPNESINLTDNYPFSEITSSASLKNFVNSGALVLNNGIEDLPPSRASRYLTLANVDELEENYPTFDDLSDPEADVSIDWSHIKNAPSFGSRKWIDPIYARVTDISASLPTSPDFNDIVAYLTTNKYMIFNGSEWEDLKEFEEGDRIILLSENLEPIYEYREGSFSSIGTPEDESTTIISIDDVSRKPAQFVYSIEDGKWYKIGDFDFTGHLDDGRDKHKAYQITVSDNSFNNFEGNNDLNHVLHSIDQAIGNIDTHKSLNEAYHDGKTIDVDEGPVVLNVDSGYAPFQINGNSLPDKGEALGQFTVYNGRLYVYHPVVNRFISVDRFYPVFGRRWLVGNTYLNFYVGSLPSNNSGILMPKRAVIISASIMFDKNPLDLIKIEIRKNDNLSPIHTIIVNSRTHIEDSLNVQLNRNDFLQTYMRGYAEDPVVLYEIAWLE